MKRLSYILICIVIFAFTPLCIFAQTQKADDTVNILLDNGDVRKYLADDIKAISHTTDKMTIAQKDGASDSYAVTDVAKVEFKFTPRDTDIEIYYLEKGADIEGCMPTTVTSMGDWSSIWISDTGAADVLTTLSFNKKEKNSILTSLSKDKFTFSYYEDFMSDKHPTAILSFVSVASNPIIYLCDVNKSTGEMLSVNSLALSNQSKALYGTRAVAVPYDDFTKSVLVQVTDLYDEIGNSMGKVSEKLTPFNIAQTTVLDYYSDILMPTLKAFTTPVPEELVEEHCFGIINESIEYLVSLCPEKIENIITKTK